MSRRWRSSQPDRAVQRSRRWCVAAARGIRARRRPEPAHGLTLEIERACLVASNAMGAPRNAMGAPRVCDAPTTRRSECGMRRGRDCSVRAGAVPAALPFRASDTSVHRPTVACRAVSSDCCTARYECTVGILYLYSVHAVCALNHLLHQTSMILRLNLDGSLHFARLRYSSNRKVL